MNRESIPLPKPFIEFAKSFGIPPAELATRILLDAARSPAAHITLKRQAPDRRRKSA